MELLQRQVAICLGLWEVVSLATANFFRITHSSHLLSLSKEAIHLALFEASCSGIPCEERSTWVFLDKLPARRASETPPTKTI